jgi:hypothetical protein
MQIISLAMLWLIATEPTYIPLWVLIFVTVETYTF